MSNPMSDLPYQLVNSDTMLATDLLAKLKTVDGAGSGLDADLWDGKHMADTSQDDIKDGTSYARVQKAKAAWLNNNPVRYSLAYWSTASVSGTKYDIRAVLSLGSGVLVAGTNSTGKILRSTDNGLTWSVVQSCSSSSAVVWVYPMVGSTTTLFAAQSNSATAYKSTDSGATWSTFTLPYVSPRSFLALDALTYLVGSNTYTVMKTVDGGANWTTPTGAPTSCYGLDIIDGVIYTQITDNVIYKSTDNGDSFSAVSGSYLSYEIHQFAKIGSIIFAFGSNTSSKYNIIKSADGGTTWSTVYQFPTSIRTMGCERGFIAHPKIPGRYFIGSGYGTLLLTNDSGATWHSMGVMSALTGLAIPFYDAYGLGVIWQGNIYRFIEEAVE
jgi:photosystem II stability/assembly factor-like uncharacterized protein